MKYKVGDRVKCLSDGTVGVVEHIRKTFVYPYIVKRNNEGVAYMASEIELIQPEVQEPIPGKFYRTKDDDKLHFVGKTKKGSYLYDDIDGDIREYGRPFKYWLDDDQYDIVGEWALGKVVLKS